MKTYLPNVAEIDKKWILLDAEKEVLKFPFLSAIRSKIYADQINPVAKGIREKKRIQSFSIFQVLFSYDKK